MDDYISNLKYKILRAREDKIKAEARINAFEEALNEYETLLFLKENEKKE